jgi:HD-GYP domain-containing protein (c-di-GMP phosphodiesterase class II)
VTAIHEIPLPSDLPTEPWAGREPKTESKGTFLLALEPHSLEERDELQPLNLIGAPFSGQPETWFGLERSDRRPAVRSGAAATALESDGSDTVSLDAPLYGDAVQALARAIEAKDVATAEHCDRVNTYAVAIGLELGLPVAEIAEIGLGAQLHDVGKIGVPERLLQKEGPLSADEYAELMAHMEIGEGILHKLFDAHSGVLSIARSHHERVDGRGRPDGLAGNDIPRAARIVAVADAFDAMTGFRPYRSPVSASAALQELEENIGSQFDGDCVRAFRTALERTGADLNETATRESVARGGPGEWEATHQPWSGGWRDAAPAPLAVTHG